MLSPKKSRGSPAKTDRYSAFDETISTFQQENQALQFTIGEKDVESERMKTTLFALNEKLMLMEDVEEDAKNQKSYFLKSEQTRA